jgi:hypothetical protein
MHMISALLVLGGVLLSSRPRGKKSTKRHDKGDDEIEGREGGDYDGEEEEEEEELDKFVENIGATMDSNDGKDCNGSAHIMRFSPPCSPRKFNGSGLDTPLFIVARVPSEQLSMAITSRTISDQVILSSRVLSL